MPTGTTDSMKLGIGQSVARVEDYRLLRGRGRFTDDLNLAGQLYGSVVHSPHPHARIAGIDAADALAAPGVVALFTGEDVEADGLGHLPSLANSAASLTPSGRFADIRAPTPRAPAPGRSRSSATALRSWWPTRRSGPGMRPISSRSSTNRCRWRSRPRRLWTRDGRRCGRTARTIFAIASRSEMRRQSRLQ